MQWARLLTDLNIALRRGAWYRVWKLGLLQAIIEVRGKAFDVPAPLIEVTATPPSKWTVVARPRDAVRLPARWGDQYAVCPSCAERQSIVGRPQRMRCQRCRRDFQVAWKDSARPVPAVVHDV